MQGGFSVRRKSVFALAAVLTVAAGLWLYRKFAAPPVIRVYTTIPEKDAAVLFQRFTDYTGLRVSFSRLSSDEMLRRVIAEKVCPQADLIIGGPADIYDAAKREGALARYVPEAAKAMPVGYRDPDNRWFGIGVTPLCFLVNRNFIEKNGLRMPDSWQDLLDPAYRGALQMVDPRASATASEQIYSLVRIYGEREAFEYQKKLAENVRAYAKNGVGGAMPVALGQAAAGVFYYVDAMSLKLEGYPVEIVFPKEGVTYAVDGCALLDGAASPEEAKYLLQWLASQDFARSRMEQKPCYLPARPELRELNKLLDLNSIRLLQCSVPWKSQNRLRLIDRWTSEVARSDQLKDSQDTVRSASVLQK